MAALELFDPAVHCKIAMLVAEQAGVAPAAVMQPTGLALEVLDDPLAVLSFRHTGILLETVEALTGDSALGLSMANNVMQEVMDAAHFDLISMETAGEAIVQSYQLLARVSNVMQVHVQTEGELSRLTFFPGDRALPGIRIMSEFHPALFTNNMRALAAPDWHPLLAYFHYAAPTTAAALERYRAWFRCPLQFGAPVTMLEYNSALHTTPMLFRDPNLRKVLRPVVEARNAELPGISHTRDLTFSAIANAVSRHTPTLDNVSQRLGISRRTLQHRLAKEGVSFQSLLDRVRAIQATRLLADDEVSIDTIAHRLGYGSSAAFHRAFRRWTGQTPWDYRRGRQG